LVIIGIDPHKRTHTASALDPVTHRVLGSVRVEASLVGYRQLLRWARQFTGRLWAVENAGGLGRHLAQWLIARAEQVQDVPSTATARVRELSRGGRRKTDVIDAAAAASVAALGGQARPVVAEDLTTVLALLDERRNNLVGHRTRLINQLHALLRDLIPGGAPKKLTATRAAEILAGVRPVGLMETTRKLLAREHIDEIRAIDTRITKLTTRIAQTVTQHGTQLTSINGVGPVVAGRLIGRTGPASRFPTASAFASYAGVAPIEIASADRARHRLSRGGNRQLNHALHLVAITQIRMIDSPGHAYYTRKTSEGKTHNEAMRCLKRRLADRVWRTMITDERHLIQQHPNQAASPEGQPGATLTSSAAGSTPTTSPSEQSQPGPATTHPTTPHPPT